MSNLHPVVKKLAWKGFNPILIWGAPESFGTVQQAFPCTVHATPITSTYSFALLFVRNRAELGRALVAVAPHLTVEDPMLWIAYPKKSSKRYDSDLARDAGWEGVAALGLEPVTQIAVDVDWSALRFRKVDRIARFTRRIASSTAGKERIQARSNEAKVPCRTPTPGKKPTRIDRDLFEGVRVAILKVLPAEEPGLPFKELSGQVAAVLPRDLAQRIGSLPWYVTTVKLELEVRGEIERVPGFRPQHLKTCVR